jgi:ribosomal protein S2
MKTLQHQARFNDRFGLSKMFDIGVHVGHVHYDWNPNLSSYLLGTRYKYFVLDIVCNIFFMRKIYGFIKALYKKKANVLFLCHGEEQGFETLSFKFLSFECQETSCYKYVGFISNWRLLYLTYFVRMRKFLKSFLQNKNKYILSLFSHLNGRRSFLQQNMLIHRFFSLYIMYICCLYSYNLMKLKELRTLNKRMRTNIFSFFKKSRKRTTKHKNIGYKSVRLMNKKSRYYSLNSVSPLWRFFLLHRYFRRNKLPSCVFFVNKKNNFDAINEFSGLDIALISTVDSNSYINNISYPLLSNDDSFVCNFFFGSFISFCIRNSRKYQS